MTTFLALISSPSGGCGDSDNSRARTATTQQHQHDNDNNDADCNRQQMKHPCDDVCTATMMMTGVAMPVPVRYSR
jgi:hypothetical protein